jgi:hypothetical protein
MGVSQSCVARTEGVGQVRDIKRPRLQNLQLHFFLLALEMMDGEGEKNVALTRPSV